MINVYAVREAEMYQAMVDQIRKAMREPLKSEPEKPLVYIASPYAKGDPALNVRFQMETCTNLLDSGLVTPHAPLLTHFLHLHKPRPHDEWLAYDIEILKRCDAVIRLASRYGDDYTVWESPGADKEVEVARQNEIPVFFAVSELLDWAKNGIR